jgi:hypothetical protein
MITHDGPGSGLFHYPAPPAHIAEYVPVAVARQAGPKTGRMDNYFILKY